MFLKEPIAQCAISIASSNTPSPYTILIFPPVFYDHITNLYIVIVTHFMCNVNKKEVVTTSFCNLLTFIIFLKLLSVVSWHGPAKLLSDNTPEYSASGEAAPRLSPLPLLPLLYRFPPDARLSRQAVSHGC